MTIFVSKQLQMQPSIDDLRKNYKRLSDDVLMKIATAEAAGLRPEAIQVIQEEINSRGLSKTLLAGMEIQSREISEIELLAYCELIRQQPCPVCHSSVKKINATIIATVISYVIMSSDEDKLIIACPDCMAKQLKDASFTTALFGWWGLPSGPFKTIGVLMQNKKMSKQIHLAEPSAHLKVFVLQNIGTIEANRSNAEGLASLLQRTNEK
jgi:hypothetical protein